MGESQPSALGLISSKRDFFETEQRIVEFILSNQADAAGMTLAQLARSSSTSEATVSRFCKRLGFGSYRSFQFSLARDVALAHDDGVTREVSLDDIEQSLRNIQNAKSRDRIDHPRHRSRGAPVVRRRDTLGGLHPARRRRQHPCGRARREHQVRPARAEKRHLRGVGGGEGLCAHAAPRRCVHRDIQLREVSPPARHHVRRPKRRATSSSSPAIRPHRSGAPPTSSFRP